MRRGFLISMIVILTFIKGYSQGYQIDVQWNELKDTSVYLAHYFNSKVYVDDTIRLDQTGKGLFSGQNQLKQGLYLLYLNESTYIDFLIGSDQKFSLSLNNSDPFNSFKPKNATETEQFKKYQQFLKELLEKQKTTNDSLKTADEEMKPALQQQLKELDQEFKTFYNSQLIPENNSMYTTFLKAVAKFEIPEPPFDKNVASYDSLVAFYSYNYRRDHFLDGINFNDERILYTPIIKPKLEEYFNQVLIQSPDSIIPQAMKILNESEKNESMYQYLTQFLLNNSAQSKIMGMDAAFVAIAEETVLKGKATWADSTTTAKIKEEVFLTKPNLIGKKAPELLMETNTGEMVSLHQTQAKYTVLIFWEPNCGHCKKEVPALYKDVFLPFMKNDIQVFAVNINDDHKEWEDFIEKEELEGWIHAWDPGNRSGFRYKYNVKSTPLVYLLDENKKIIAKRIDNTSLSKLLTSLLKE